MPSSHITSNLTTDTTRHVVKEEQIEYGFIGKLQNLKYEYRSDIRDRAALERNFREKFEALNRVNLSDAEFKRLLEEIVTPDVFTAARTLREPIRRDSPSNSIERRPTGRGWTFIRSLECV